MQINQDLNDRIISDKIDVALHGFLQSKQVGLSHILKLISYSTSFIVREHVNEIMNLALKRLLNEIK